MNISMFTRQHLLNFFTGDSTKIVDTGCNTGETFGDRAVNVDNLSLSELRDECGDETLVIPNFIQADAAHLPFKKGCFSWAVLSELLEHVDDPLAVINEAQRVAKAVFICVPNEYQWHPDNKPFQNPHHKRFFTEQSLRKLINDAGLIDIEFAILHYGGWSLFIVVGVSKYYNIELDEEEKKFNIL